MLDQLHYDKLLRVTALFYIYIRVSTQSEIQRSQTNHRQGS